MQLDEVHGGHGEAGAVHEAANVAVERDVIDAELVCFFIALQYTTRSAAKHLSRSFKQISRSIYEWYKFKRRKHIVSLYTRMLYSVHFYLYVPESVK